jgi:hypothetical protein
MKKRTQAPLLAFLLSLLLCPSAWAHVGSPDVYYEGMAGPYRLFVTVRMPQMIPGVAQVQAKVLDGRVSEIRMVPMRVIGEGSETAPPADRMEPAAADPQSFSGKLWLMESGSFQVRMTVDGAQGKAELAVPVAAFAQRTLRMQKTTGSILAVLMTLLVLSLIGILGAAVRESHLEPGQDVPQGKRTRGRVAMLVTAAAIFGILFLGNLWWTSVADANARDMVYKAPPVQVSLSGDQLTLKLGSSYWHELRKSEQLNKIIPDHGHLMHLFLVRMPEMDDFYHLHPDETSAETFTQSLPGVAGGSYAVFADIVRESGFPDTMTAKIDLPTGEKGKPLAGDDSSVVAPKVSEARTNGTTVPLGADAHVEWVLDAKGLKAQNPDLLRFRVIGKNGGAATDLEPYMGMAGHLVILRRDLSVFAHVHPAGSVPMAALMLLQKPAADDGGSLAMMAMHHEAVPAEITFPYGFPQAGEYRLFLQVRRAGQVETAVFEAQVTP